MMVTMFLKKRFPLSLICQIFGRHLKIFFKNYLEYMESLVHHCSCYGFAKMVEAVILWGSSPDGKVFVDLSLDDIYSNRIQTHLPGNLHKEVENSRILAENLFYAHLNFVKSKRLEMDQEQIHDEVLMLFHWAPWFGMVYAVSKELHALL